MRRIDPVRAIVGSGAVLLLALAAVLWIGDCATAMRAGRPAQPVSVEIAGPADGAAIEVVRVSPRGNRLPLAQLPGRLQWTSGHEWFAGLEVSAEEAALASIRSLTVTIGSNRFDLAGEELRERAAKRPDEGMGRRTFAVPASMRAGHSRVATCDRLLNWPGDFAALCDLLFNVRAYRVGLVLLWMALHRFHRRGGPERQSALERFALRATTGVLALFVIAVLGPVFVSRLPHPLSVEHLEGVQAACTAIWTKQGGDLYSPPTIEGCGNLYTPGYYLASAAWGRLFGLTLPSLRALTWLCIAIGALSAVGVLRELGSRRSARWWLPLYLATFCFYGWIDNANKDALHVGLAMAGFAFLSRSLRNDGACTGATAAALGGVIWAAAFMTKQSHVAIVAPTLLVLLFVAPRSALVAGGTFALGVAAATFAAVKTWPDYWDWTVVIPKAHAFSFAALSNELGPAVAALAGYFAAAFLGWRDVARGDDARRRRLAHVCLAFAAGGLVMGFLSAGKARGGIYAVAPGLAALSILAAAALAAAGPISGRGRPTVALLLLLLVLRWPADAFVHASDRRAARRLMDLVAAEHGEVWVPLEPFANVVAGRRAFVPAFCLGEWTAAGRPLPETVLEPIRAGRFACIVTPWNLPAPGGAELDGEPYRTIAQYYELAQILPRGEAYAPKDGWVNSMRLVWRRHER